jgi:hypothetical protein
VGFQNLITFNKYNNVMVLTKSNVRKQTVPTAGHECQGERHMGCMWADTVPLIEVCVEVELKKLFRGQFRRWSARDVYDFSNIH